MNRSERRKYNKEKNCEYYGTLRHKTYNPKCYCESTITEKDLIKINEKLFVRCPKCGYEVPIKCIVSWRKSK